MQRVPGREVSSHLILSLTLSFCLCACHGGDELTTKNEPANSPTASALRPVELPLTTVRRSSVVDQVIAPGQVQAMPERSFKVSALVCAGLLK